EWRTAGLVSGPAQADVASLFGARRVNATPRGAGDRRRRRVTRTDSAGRATVRWVTAIGREKGQSGPRTADERNEIGTGVEGMPAMPNNGKGSSAAWARAAMARRGQSLPDNSLSPSPTQVLRHCS